MRERGGAMGEERKSGEETSTWLCMRERRGNIAAACN